VDRSDKLITACFIPSIAPAFCVVFFIFELKFGFDSRNNHSRFPFVVGHFRQQID
jgi:hypothetical protein